MHGRAKGVGPVHWDSDAPNVKFGIEENIWVSPTPTDAVSVSLASEACTEIKRSWYEINCQQRGDVKHQFQAFVKKIANCLNDNDNYIESYKDHYQCSDHDYQ